MKEIILLFLVVSCAQVPAKKQAELVSVNAALNHAQASYLKGCVDALKELKMTSVFPGCREKSIIHRRELDAFMDLEI